MSRCTYDNMELIIFGIFLYIFRYNLEIQLREQGAIVTWHKILTREGHIDSTIWILRENIWLYLRHEDKSKEYKYSRDDSCKVESSTHCQTNCCRYPYIRSGRETFCSKTISHDSASTEKSYTRNYLCCYTRRIIVRRMIEFWYDNRKDHKETWTHTNKYMCTYTCWLLFIFSLDTEYQCEHETHTKAYEYFCIRDKNIVHRKKWYIWVYHFFYRKTNIFISKDTIIHLWTILLGLILRFSLKESMYMLRYDESLIFRHRSF